MTDPTTRTVDIYLKVDHQSIDDCFNENDPAPLYKRQLSYKLEQYINMATSSVKRYSVVLYKFNCNTEIDKQYTEPLIYALRRHFNARQEIREREFSRFKRRTWMLLLVSLGVVILFQGFLMVLFNMNHNLQSGFSNILDVFSWVVLWQPFDKLLFYWNPHLKDISLLKKLANAEVIILSGEK
ncbi:MAG TPA: hypothetical protein VK666_03095 [Chryseolinea sp.]|nr:hypothetical protein [Chryseolinea sp.]